jgi:hypothetical protein
VKESAFPLVALELTCTKCGGYWHPHHANDMTLGVAALPACALAVFRVETAIYRGRNDGPY